jgi:hypothetical protein
MIKSNFKKKFIDKKALLFLFLQRNKNIYKNFLIFNSTHIIKIILIKKNLN